MSTKIVYGNGKVAFESGAYHAFRSGVVNPPIQSDYGKILIINSGGFGADFGFGSGINGSHKSGLESVIDNIQTPQDLQKLFRGGVLYDLAYSLFAPEAGAQGASEIAIINAATTTKATAAITLTNGTVTISPWDEGTCANGEVNADDELVKGYGIKLSAHPSLVDKFVFGFFIGSWKGLDGSGAEIGTPKADLTEATLLIESDPVGTVEELVAWMQNNFAFKQIFKYESHTGSGAIVAGDITAWAGGDPYLLASGATTAFDDSDLTDTTNVMNDIAFNLILSDQYGDSNVDGSKNTRLQYYLDNVSKYRKHMFVGAGKDSTEYESVSKVAAQYFDSNKITVVHSGIGVSDKEAIGGYREMPSIYHAAIVCARNAGLPPQVPSTSKSIRVDKMLHKMTEPERKDALDYGILHSFYDGDYQKIVINQGINSMQKNDYVIDNNESKSHLIAVERIFGLLQMNMIINAKKQILADPNGVNQATLTIPDMITWTSGFLKTQTASKKNGDNLILSYRNISVVKEQDGYIISHDFEPNSEINKLIFISTII